MGDNFWQRATKIKKRILCDRYDLEKIAQYTVTIDWSPSLTPLKSSLYDKFLSLTVITRKTMVQIPHRPILVDSNHSIIEQRPRELGEYWKWPVFRGAKNPMWTYLVFSVNSVLSSPYHPLRPPTSANGSICFLHVERTAQSWRFILMICWLKLQNSEAFSTKIT